MAQMTIETPFVVGDLVRWKEQHPIFTDYPHKVTAVEVFEDHVDVWIQGTGYHSTPTKMWMPHMWEKVPSSEA